MFEYPYRHDPVIVPSLVAVIAKMIDGAVLQPRRSRRLDGIAVLFGGQGQAGDTDPRSLRPMQPQPDPISSNR